MKIGLLSDTHSYLDPRVAQLFEKVDQIWHAGDFGSISLVKDLEQLKPLIGVYGNIDDSVIRRSFPEYIVFEAEQIKVLMIHIGGYPKKYPSKVKSLIQAHQPDLFICGHSHILKVMMDRDMAKPFLCMNPGAAGMHGFQQVRTMLRFDINKDKIENLEVIELGKK